MMNEVILHPIECECQECLEKWKLMNFQNQIEKAVNDIKSNHDKIIDDWCKAYLAQRYVEGKSIDVGSFTLCQQNLSWAQHEVGFKYWFEDGKPDFYNNAQWIDCKIEMPPQDKKFIFSYHCGEGIGQYGQCYTIIGGNSERTHHSYILILNPWEILDGNDPFTWSEEKMIEMEVKWMLIPSREQQGKIMDDNNLTCIPKDAEIYQLVNGKLTIPEDTYFVTINRETHGTKHELFIYMSVAFEKLKEHKNKPDLKIEDVEFIWYQIPTDVFRSEYTCKFKARK